MFIYIDEERIGTRMALICCNCYSHITDYNNPESTWRSKLTALCSKCMDVKQEGDLFKIEPKIDNPHLLKLLGEIKEIA